MIRIELATDYTPTPGGRYIMDGPYSGEEFRDKILKKYFVDPEYKDKKIVLSFNGIVGVGASFLEETFGGLVRTYGKKAVDRKIEIIADDDPLLIEEIQGYMRDAEK